MKLFNKIGLTLIISLVFGVCVHGCGFTETKEIKEICNGRDDNGNGEIDEGCDDDHDNWCDASMILDPPSRDCPPSHFKGDCDDTNPNIHPGALEVCNSIDDNCNGEIDENLSQPCYTACGNGFSYCLNGTWTECDAPKPTPEGFNYGNCDGFDNDCDGSIDEGCPCDGFLEGTINLCYGLNEVKDCVQGMQICMYGQWTYCFSPEENQWLSPPETETCDNFDNDCNGVVDNGTNNCGGACELSANPGDPCDSDDPDTCQEGIWICNGLNSVICDSSAVHLVEICNGLDDDCDGLIDEDFLCQPGSTRNCTTSCGSIGSQVCDSFCVWQSCNPPAETCNGLDDDCDGQSDEGFTCRRGSTENCTTSCGTIGTRTCNSSCNWGNCVPPIEICNNRDDDCDGSVDEGFFCRIGSSRSCTTSCGSVGIQICTTSCIWGICSPPAETCNGLDDDCDGLIDEDFLCQPGSTRNCTTSCGSIGSQVCDSFCVWQSCNPPAETCNGWDDDCDGLIDEDCCLDRDRDGYYGQDSCFTGTDCDDNTPFANPGLVEICDEIDNDCDGITDEECNTPFSPVTAPFNPPSGALRGVYEGGLPGDCGRTRLGTFDSNSGLHHYIIKFYWNLDSGETVTSARGCPTIAMFANDVWNSGRMPLLDIKTNGFVDNTTGLNATAVNRLREFVYWLRESYYGQIAIALFPEMNLNPSPYCSSSWSTSTCINIFKRAFRFVANMIRRAAPNAYVGLNYNMRWYAGSGGGPGTRYIDWAVEREYYSWVGYNIFVHACHDGRRETEDIWFLKAALTEPGNDFQATFCGDTPCIIAETGASNQCSAGYQNWWLDRFAIGSSSGQPYFNIHLPRIKGYIWFNQNNASLGGWEENWQIQDYNYYRSIFGNSYYRSSP